MSKVLSMIFEFRSLDLHPMKLTKTKVWTSCAFKMLLAIAVPVGYSCIALAQEQPMPADPLTAHVDTTDVARFAALWKKTNGHATAAQIDSEYIREGGKGVKVFTPMRIKDGDNMEK